MGIPRNHGPLVDKPRRTEVFVFARLKPQADRLGPASTVLMQDSAAGLDFPEDNTNSCSVTGYVQQGCPASHSATILALLALFGR